MNIHLRRRNECYINKCFSILRTVCIQFIRRKSNFSSLAILVNVSYTCTLITLCNSKITDTTIISTASILWLSIYINTKDIDHCQVIPLYIYVVIYKTISPFCIWDSSIWKKKCAFLRRKWSIPLMKTGINFLPQRTV